MVVLEGGLLFFFIQRSVVIFGWPTERLFSSHGMSVNDEMYNMPRECIQKEREDE